AENISSPVDLPVFDNSSVDGYAVHATDTAGATPQHPVRLHLAGKVPAGQSFKGPLAAHNCIRIFTGSPLPADADAIVMQEDTRVEVAKPSEILVLEPVKPWENVRFRGEDVKHAATLGERGDALSAGRAALFAAA